MWRRLDAEVLGSWGGFVVTSRWAEWVDWVLGVEYAGGMDGTDFEDADLLRVTALSDLTLIVARGDLVALFAIIVQSARSSRRRSDRLVTVAVMALELPGYPPPCCKIES